jgi:PAS domain S-box-containing protein
MSSSPPLPSDTTGEIASLIATLHETERRLAELTGGEVDTVADLDGRPFLLRSAQDQMRQNHAYRQAAILNALPANIALLDGEGVIVSINDTWREFGAANAMDRPDEVVGRNYLEVCDRAPSDTAPEASAAAAGIRDVLQGRRGSFSLEYSCHSPTTRRWFELSVTPLSSPHGAVVMHLDITARKEAAYELKETEERFSSALEHARIGVTLVSPEGRWLKVNGTLCDMLGYSEAELLTYNIQDLTHPEEIESSRELMSVMLCGDAPSRQTETRYLHKNGRTINVLVDYSLVCDPRAQPAYFVAQVQDITTRKLTESALRDSDQKFHQLADNITDVFWIRSADMTEFHYVSPAFERIWGRSVESLYENPQIWFDSIVPEDRDRMIASLPTNTGESFADTEYRIRRPDGSVRWVRSRHFQIHNQAGLPVRNLGIVTDITDRHDSMAALEASESEFRTLSEAVPQIIWISKTDVGNVYCNQQWTDYTGLTLEQSLGDGWAKAFHPEDRPHAESAWHQAAIEGIPYSMESRLRRADGIYRWWLIRTVPFRASDGNILKWFGTCTDIDDLKVAEIELLRANRDLEESSAALRESTRELLEQALQLESERSRLETAQQIAMIGGWETDLTTMETTWSGETESIYETELQTAVATRDFVLSLVHPEDRAYVAQAFARPAIQHTSRSVEYRLSFPDGRIKFVEERWHVLFDKDDLPVRTIGTCQDITERRQSEEALRQSQKRLRHLFDGLGPSVFIGLLTPQGILVETNEPSLKLAGLLAEDVLGKPLDETPWWSESPQEQQKLRAAIARAARGEGSRYDVRVQGAQDHLIDVDFSLEPLRNDAGKVEFLTMAGIVITERKMAEAALRQSQKIEAVGQLAAGIAHEFNNLLQALMSMSAIIRFRTIVPEIAALGMEMETLIKRGAGLTQQLLLFSRQRPVEKTTLDLNAEVQKANGMLRHLIGETVSLVLETTHEPLPIEGDTGQIQQILLNLALNARDAMPDGGTLTLRTGIIDKEVFVQVEDTGHGMDETVCKRLFEPFFTTKEPGKGTGLGLAVVHGIVQQHGGRIDVTSSGAGSRFHVALPLSVHEAVLPEEAKPEVTPAAGSGRVLLVEDNEGVRTALTVLLEVIGYEVVSTGSAEEAIALELDPPPRVLLSDVTLPGMAGPLLAERMVKRFPSVKVVLMSGYVEKEDQTSGWRFIQKPFELDALAHELLLAGAAEPTVSGNGPGAGPAQPHDNP